MIAPTAYQNRNNAAACALDPAFDRAAPFDPEYDTLDTAYCLDAPDCIPTGGLSRRPFGEYTRRRFLDT